jgi:hypothetical protein
VTVLSVSPGTVSIWLPGWPQTSEVSVYFLGFVSDVKASVMAGVGCEADPVTIGLMVDPMPTNGCRKWKKNKWLPGTGSNRRPSD